MQKRSEIARQALVLLAVLAIPLVVVIALSTDPSSEDTAVAAYPDQEARERPREPERKPTRERKTNPGTKADKRVLLQDEEDGRSSATRVDVDPDDAARCKLADSSSQGEDLPNARLFYRAYEGEEPAPDLSVNRATGCLFATGRRTEFGFSSTIEGQSFGQAIGAGDFVAFVMNMWEASDGSDDGFAVWNLRTGESVFDQPACNDRVYGQDECYVSDIELTARGSAAFSACEGGSATEAMSCRVYLVPDGATKRYRVGQIVREDGIPPALLNKDGRLYWLGGDDKLQSVPFN